MEQNSWEKLYFYSLDNRVIECPFLSSAKCYVIIFKETRKNLIFFLILRKNNLGNLEKHILSNVAEQLSDTECIVGNDVVFTEYCIGNFSNSLITA